MLSRFLDLFDPERCPKASTLFELIVSDYLAYYGAWASPGYKIRTGREQPEPETKGRLALLFTPRVVNNPSMHATIMLRLAMAGPRWMIGFWKTALIAKHSMDINPVMEIGPGLMLPHPVGILLGQGLKVGSRVTILHHVSIGGDPRIGHDAPQLSPEIGDGVIIYTQSIVIGPIKIGDEAVIGARSWVYKDVEAGAVRARRD